MKVEGIWIMRIKLHNGIIQTFQNVRFALSTTINVISLGEMTSQWYMYVGLNWGARCTRGYTWCCEGRKIGEIFSTWKDNL